MFDLVGALFGSSGAASRGIGFSAICAAIGLHLLSWQRFRKESKAEIGDRSDAWQAIQYFTMHIPP